MNWIYPISTLLAGGVMGWSAARLLKVPQVKSDTTLFFKRSAVHMKFYSSSVLRGTLYVSVAALGVMLKTLMEWLVFQEKSEPITELHVRILWVGVALASATAWLAYIDKNWATKTSEKQKADENNTQSHAKILG